LVKQLGSYEDKNLKSYAEGKYENFLLLKHPMKPEMREILESLVIGLFLIASSLKK
jgi:hypothetical protein